jgi:integrase
MGVKVRERFPGQWWLYVNHKNQRCAKPVGEKDIALTAKKIMEEQLALGLFQFPKREPPKPKELPKPTIKEYWETFKETYLKTGVAESTADGYKKNFKNHVLPALGKLRLNEVTTDHMDTFITDLVANKKLAKGTIQKILTELSGMFSWAIKHDVIAKNSASCLSELYSQAPTRHEKIEPLTEEEAPLFLAEVQKNRHTKKHYALFLAAIHTGLRAGELAGLEWSDIDFHGGFADVQRSYDRVHRKIVPTKTKQHRRVDLSDELIEALAELQKRRLE